MAYMVDDKGPYPNKAGEFCGNHHPAGPDRFVMPMHGETLQQAADHEREYLARMRFGQPHPCKDASVTAENGWVGLYLKKDSPLFDWETPCDTPPELLEPTTSPTP